MSTQEPLSTSVENPKHKSALLDQYQEEKKQLKEKPKEMTKELDKLPLPCGWRILVLPFEAYHTILPVTTPPTAPVP